MMAHGKTESRLTCAGQAAHLGADYSTLIIGSAGVEESAYFANNPAFPAVVTPIVFPLLDDVVSCVAKPIVVNFEAESFELFLL